MLHSLATCTRSARRRSGSVLIVVLAMLVLFALLGLSFVLYSESQLSSARSQKLSVNQESDPDPLAAAEGYLGKLVYDVGDVGDDLMNPIRGHSLSRSKYGHQAGVATLLPFNSPVGLSEAFVQVPINMPNSLDIVRFTWDSNTNCVYDPERFYWFGSFDEGILRNDPSSPLIAKGSASYHNGSYLAKNYGFTYPDRHDFYLAQMNRTPASCRTAISNSSKLSAGQGSGIGSASSRSRSTTTPTRRSPPRL